MTGQGSAGGGGGANGSSSSTVGGGGGTGGIVDQFINVLPGDVITIIITPGGIGAAAWGDPSGSGQQGGNTTIIIEGTNYVCQGGFGGTNQGIGGKGGTGPTATGLNGGNYKSGQVGGDGAWSYLHIGNNGVANPGVNGTNGTLGCGGGGGSGSNNDGYRTAGGNGGSGYVKIFY